MTIAITYTVIYCVGGTENFKWKRALPVATWGEALAQAETIERAGRPALIHKTKELDALGLPETFAAIAKTTQ